MSVQVGAAHALFELRYSSLTQGVSAVEAQLKRLRQQTAQPITVRADGTRAAQGLQSAHRAAQAALGGFDRLERQFDQTRDSEIRAARAAGDHARALSLVDSAIDRATPDTIRYNNLLAQQATLQRAAAREAQQAARVPRTPTAPAGGGAGLVAGLAAGAGALGIAAGAQQLISYGASAVQAAGQLRQTQNITRSLTQTQTGYNAVVALARENQARYGGSLQENLASLSGLAIQSRTTGVAIGELNDLAARLAILSPEQGIGGASIALREALAGETQSLAERFELPRKALAGLRDMSLSAAERVKLLGVILTEAGVSSQTVADSFDETTTSINEANAAVDDLKIASGEALAPITKLAADGLTRLIRAAQGSAEEIVKLKAVLAGRGGYTEAEVSAERVAQANADVVESMAAIAAGPLVTKGAVGGLPDAARITAALYPLRALVPLMGEVSAASAQGAAQVNAMLRQVADGSLSVPVFTQRLGFLAQQQRDSAAATGSAGSAYVAYGKAAAGATTELGAALLTEQEALATKERTVIVQSAIADLAGDVVDGHQKMAAAAALLASQYGLAAGEAELLLKAQALIIAQAGAAQGLAEQRAGERSAGDLRTQADIDEARRIADQARVRAALLASRRNRDNLPDADRGAAARAAAIEAAAARRAQLDATGTTVQRLTAARGDLAGLTKGSADYIRKQTEIIQLERQLAAERQAGAAGATKATTQHTTATERQTAAVEQQITAEERLKSALDARLAVLDDRKSRRLEERELATARRVLASASTSQDQRAAARDVLERIPLEREKRAAEIAAQQGRAGGIAAVPGQPRPRGPADIPALPALGGVGGVQAGAASGADVLNQLVGALRALQINVYADSAPLAARVLIELRGGLAGAVSAQGG